MLLLVVFSQRYRERMRQATSPMSDACDFAEASHRRLAAARNGGQPVLTVVSVDAQHYD